MEVQKSLFDKIISKPRAYIVYFGIAAFFLIILLIAAILDNAINDLASSISWRGLLIPPTIIVYILTIAPIMHRYEKKVLKSFYDIIAIDDSKVEEVISQTSKINPWKEIMAIGTGVILGVLIAMGSVDGSFSWISLYWLFATVLMITLLVWTIFVSIISTRLTSTLLKQPLVVDPFDTTPFEPIGKQSLMIALAFIGGITLSLIFIGLDYSNFKQPVFWLFYIPLALIPLVLFFLNMAPTHRVLAHAKAQELKSVRFQMYNTCRILLHKMEDNQETKNIPAEITALAVYEKQLRETRTWPYNTAMLRTLFFSVLIPVGTLIGRIVIEALSN
jgi:hypothetical protein